MEPPPLGSAHLAQDDLGKGANHHAFLSLPSREIAAFLHDTAQTARIPPGSGEREGPGTIALVRPWVAEGAGEGLSTARGGKAGDHSDSAGRPRAPLGARRRGRCVPFARRRDSPRPGSWHALPEMQHTVLFVLGLKGTMSEAELFVLRARLQGGIRNYARRGALKLALPIGLCYTRSATPWFWTPMGPRASHHARGLSPL